MRRKSGDPGVLGAVLAVACGGLLAAFSMASCSDGGSTEEVCSNCLGNNVVWDCFGGFYSSSRKYKGSICQSYNSDYIAAIAACNADHGTAFWTCQVAELAPCENAGGGATESNASESSCNDWDPDGEIALVSGVYEIEKAFVDYVVADPMRLVNCDTSTIEFSSSTSEYQVKNATSGTILYELGFRNNDVVTEVNGRDLDTHSDAAKAYGTEYLKNGETSYEFTVLRNANSITIEVEIVS